jgi:hypothetical protein
MPLPDLGEVRMRVPHARFARNELIDTVIERGKKKA